MEAPILSAEQIRLCRGRFVLDIPRLEISRGQPLAVVGPNGAGKSTLLNILMGLERGFEGTLFHNGRPLPQKPRRPVLEWRRKMGAVFQNPLLLDDTVMGNLLTALSFKGIRGPEARSEALRWLAYFGIPDYGPRRARTLSGGEAQRVSLARAFAGRPEIIFLDEPFAALDPPSRTSLIGDLADVLHRTGITAVLVTHMFDEMAVLCQRAMVMVNGTPRQTGSCDQILYHPASPAVARFVGMENLYPATVTPSPDGKYLLQLNRGGPQAILETAPLTGPVMAGFRPEFARILAPSESAEPESWTLSGNILRIAPGLSGYRLTVGGFVEAVVECNRPGLIHERFSIGQTVAVTVPDQAWHIMPTAQDII